MSSSVSLSLVNSGREEGNFHFDVSQMIALVNTKGFGVCSQNLGIFIHYL